MRRCSTKKSVITEKDVRSDSCGQQDLTLPPPSIETTARRKLKERRGPPKSLKELVRSITVYNKIKVQLLAASMVNTEQEYITPK